MADVNTKLEAAGVIATKAAYTTSAGITVVGTMTAQELAAVFGMVLGILTLTTNVYINWYWRKKSHELELEKLRLRRKDDEESDITG